jgi:hypothetical protein
VSRDESCAEERERYKRPGDDAKVFHDQPLYRRHPGSNYRLTAGPTFTLFVTLREQIWAKSADFELEAYDDTGCLALPRRRYAGSCAQEWGEHRL